MSAFERAPLVVAGKAIPDSLDRVRRYAGLSWSGGEPEIWAFPYYDALPTERDDIVTRSDVLCTAALHPGLSRTDLAFFIERQGDIAAWLRSVRAGQLLWESSDQLMNHLERLVDFEPDVSITLLTKVLHRKRPNFVPLLDRHVINLYRRADDPRRASDMWPLIVRRMCDDLTCARVSSRKAVVPIVGDDPETAIHVPLMRYIDIAIWMEGR